MPGGVGGVLLGTSFLPRSSAGPPFLRSGGNTELESSSHLPRTEEWPMPRGERASLSLLLPGDKITAPGLLLGLSIPKILQEFLS